LDLGGVSNYQAFDKWLDQAYMLTFLAVAVRWTGATRSVAIALFAYRLAGFLLFEVTGERWILLLFPNVFEFWFLFVASLPHWRTAFAFSPPYVAVCHATLTAGKLVQEYVIHVGQWFDRFSTRAVVAALSFWT